MGGRQGGRESATVDSPRPWHLNDPMNAQREIEYLPILDWYVKGTPPYV
jgi:hypothetical protein